MPSTTLVLLLATVALGAQQPGSQAAPPDSVVIGRVVDATTGAPLAGAIVALIPTETAGPSLGDSPGQRVLTSDDGEFVFGPIAASSYRLWVTAPGYLSAGYGQRPGGASQPLAVAAHEIVDGLTISMRKGAVVSGTVTDEAGEPVIGALVNVIRRTWTAGRAQWETIGTPATDDRGVYRLPNLQPGEYSAFVPGMRVSYPAGFTPTAQVGSAVLELNRYSTTVYPLNESGSPKGLSNLTTISAAGSMQNERIGGFLSQTPQQARSIAPGAASMRGYPTTFAPGVPSPAGARVLSVAAGELAANLDIQLQLVPTVTISGTIETPSGPGANVLVRLGPADRSGEISNVGSSTAIGVSDANGAFALHGVPAGEYELRASQGLWRSTLPPASVVLPVAVDNKDIVNLTVSLRPAVTISGRVEFDGDRTKASQSGLVLLRDNYPMKLPPQGPIDGNGRFAVAAEPGTYAVSTESDNRGSWFVKSAMTNGRDIATVPAVINADVTDVVLTLTDKPAGVEGTARQASGAADPLAVVLIFPVDRSLWGIEIGTGDEITDWTITLSDTPSEFTGVLQDASGRAAPDYFIVVFARDKARWTPQSRWIAAMRPGTDGRFVVKGLPSGGYFVAAVTDVEEGEWFMRDFLETLVPAAAPVTISAGKKTVQDLKIGGAYFTRVFQ